MILYKYSYSLAILVFYFLHAVFSLLLASVEAVTRDESFKVESSIVLEVLKLDDSYNNG